MLHLSKLQQHKKHLKERCKMLIEKANNYKHIDEHKSDRAAFKAMKIAEKLNKVSYLDRSFISQNHTL